MVDQRERREGAGGHLGFVANLMSNFGNMFLREKYSFAGGLFEKSLESP